MTDPENMQVPTGPLDAPPYVELPGLTSIESARAIWRHAVRGLPMGEYDERLVAWAVRAMDQPMLVGFASLIERARAANVPQEGDPVETWLTAWIDELRGNVGQANAVRAMREDYRAHARHGTPLGQDIPAPPPAADAPQDRDGAA